MDPRRELRLLLLEARKDRAMQEHERGCLLRAGDLEEGQIDILDVHRRRPTPDVLGGYHGVFIGGTGDYSVARNRPPFFEPFLDLCRHLLEQGTPVLGLCYGFHLMARAVGGQVETRPEMAETGTCEVELTEEGLRDPILDGLPRRFRAQQGHHDAVLTLPEPFVLLATNPRCRIQAFRHPEAPYYGLQFHPELGRRDFMKRMVAYRDSYARTPELFARIDAQVTETRNQEVIRKYIDRVVLPRSVRP